MDNKFYVYIHLKPGTDEVFYVGRGCGFRIKEKQGRNKWWNNIVNKYGFDFLKIEEWLTHDQADELEEYWIYQFKNWGFKLVNMCYGEKKYFTHYGKKHSEQTKIKNRETHTGNKYNLGRKMPQHVMDAIIKSRKGVPISEEHKQILRDKLKGRIFSEETRKKISIATKGRKNSKEQNEKHSKIMTGRKASEETKNKMSLSNRGTNHYNSKLKEKDVVEIRNLWTNKILKPKELSIKFKVSISNIEAIVSKRTWKHIS